MANAISVIYPYWIDGLWVFDDERTGLVQEPFISGADELIDRMVTAKGIKNASDGFRLMFSAGEFPGHDLKLDWVREGDGGNWYRAEALGMEGWLCPALFKYFDEAPKHLFAKFEAKPV